ncbi:alginate biosynthesis protein AlgX [Enterovibrio sp. FF113]|uniref:alginate O-acetyltransferase AlgX-related protein n=1 Tax=Enterovibrio sp. FF113 TaxID=3230010 RepID=UPI00352EC920
MKRSIIFLVLALMSLGVKAVPEYPISIVTSVCSEATIRANFPQALATAAFPLVLDDDGWMSGGSRELSHGFVESDLKDLERLLKAIKSQGTSYVYFALAPPRTLEKGKLIHGEYSNRETLKNAYLSLLSRLNDVGFLTSDLSKDMNTASPSFYFKRDTHWRPEGAKISAKNISDALSENKILNDIPLHSVESFINGYNIQSSDFFNQVMQDICGYKLPTEHAPNYESTPDVDADIFGDSLTPDISLIGTSYSENENYHFANFLRGYLQRDIVNHSISGGGEYGAWFNFFSNKSEDSTPPKIIIWELPSYSHPARYKHLRQIIPLVNNGCQTSESIAEITDTVTEKGKKEFIFDPALFGFKASELVMDIQSDDPQATSLSFRVWFDSGFYYDFTIDVIDADTADGRFVFELANKEWDYRGNILAIDLLSATYSSTSTPLSLTGNVCLNAFRG